MQVLPIEEIMCYHAESHDGKESLFSYKCPECKGPLNRDNVHSQEVFQCPSCGLEMVVQCGNVVINETNQ